MPDPATVWMVHKGTGRPGIRGELILESKRLIFRPEIRTAKPDMLGETVFALEEINRSLVRLERCRLIADVTVSQTDGF